MDIWKEKDWTVKNCEAARYDEIINEPILESKRTILYVTIEKNHFDLKPVARAPGSSKS